MALDPLTSRAGRVLRLSQQRPSKSLRRDRRSPDVQDLAASKKPLTKEQLAVGAPAAPPPDYNTNIFAAPPSTTDQHESQHN